MTRKELPANRADIERYLTAVRARVIEDLGPTEDDMSGIQIVLCDRLISILGCVRCMEEAAREGKTELSKHYLSFNNTIAKICNILGVEKKVTEEILDLQTYVKEKYGKKGEENGESKQTD